MKRLYVVVRQDIDPGLQLAQAVHSAAELALRWRTALEVWDASPAPTVVVLGARNEAHLQELYAKLVALEARGNLAIARALFHEPDLAGQATALGCFGDAAVRRLFSSLPKALKGVGDLAALGAMVDAA
jgi:hypothetical protein